MKHESFNELYQKFKSILYSLASKFKRNLVFQQEILQTTPSSVVNLINLLEARSFGIQEKITDLKLFMAKYHNKKHYENLRKFEKLRCDTNLGLERKYHLKQENERIHTTHCLGDFYDFEDFDILAIELIDIFKVCRKDYNYLQALEITNLDEMLEYIKRNRHMYLDLWDLIEDKLISLNIFMAVFYEKNHRK